MRVEPRKLELAAESAILVEPLSFSLLRVRTPYIFFHRMDPDEVVKPNGPTDVRSSKG